MNRLYKVVRLLCAVALVLAVMTPDVLAQGTGRVVGRVTDENGNPLEGATLVIVLPDTSRRAGKIIETTTDDSGRYALGGFEAGNYTFTVSKEGYTTIEGPARIRQTSNPEFNWTIDLIPHPLILALGKEAMEGLDPDAVDAEMMAATEAFNGERWDDAIAGFEALLVKIPLLTRLNIQIGHAHYGKSDYEQAVASYERLLVSNPDDEEAKAAIARTRMAMGDFEAASAGLAAAASGLDASREDLYNLGELEFAKGAIDEAAQWYEKATMADPNWGKPLFKLALVALNKGDTETAKQYFKKVVAVDPNSTEAAQAQATLGALP